MNHTDERIESMAARQHGVVSRPQLLAEGISRSAITRRVRAKRLRGMHLGVYRVGLIEAPRAAEMAAVLAGGPKALLSHVSALHAWGLIGGELPRPIHVSVPGSGRARRPGICFHRLIRLEDHERSAVEGIPVTAVPRTLVDAAGLLGRREIEAAVSLAEREGLISSRELADLPARYPRRRGLPGLRYVIEAVNGPAFTRSEAERRCLDLYDRAGLPRPHTNVAVGPYEVDQLWPDAGVAVEIDGRAFHRGSVRFEGDRRKGRWLAARGIRLVRLTWKQITREPLLTAVEVGQVLALAMADRAAQPTAGDQR